MLFLVTESVTAQDLTRHNWLFGNSPFGIRFNRTNHSASLITNKTPLNIGGSGVATNPINGNLLFYTDGNTIYDATHAPMPNGTGLGGNPLGNQPVAIAKAPGQKSQYYVFTNTADGTTGGTVTYRLVDMSLFGNSVFPAPPLGEAIGAANTPIAGLAGRSEAMITIAHANGEDFWLITHANGTPDYTVTQFDATGPVSSISYTGVGLIEVANNFAYHPASGRIAVSTQENTRDVEIVNFDAATGVITFGQRVLNTGIASTTDEAIYDMEWSGSGQYLYISRHGEAGIQADVLQVDLLNNFATPTSVLPQPNTIANSFGLQMGPDSLIYHLYQETAGGPFIVASMANTDTIASEVIYTTPAFASNPDFAGMQFAAFAPKDTIDLDVEFIAEGTCSNSPVSFYPTVTPAADSLVWDFGDGNGGFGWSPVHTYEAGGSYQVSVTAFLSGDTAMHFQTLNITQFDIQLQLVQDTTACACELPINNGKPTANPGITCPDDTSDDMVVTVQAQGGNPQFQWFGPGGILPTQTTAELRPDSAGYYYVVATDPGSGCSVYAGVNIKEYDSLNQQMNIWHFGNQAGIDFNGLPNDPIVPIVGPLNAPEGTSVISDRNGQVIFSTDGQNIFVRGPGPGHNYVDITPAPNPPGIGGDPQSAQSALIVPVPGDETLFYIFTTQAADGANGTYELRYSLFDLKLNNGTGGLAQYNQLLFSPSTERITSNGNWLIAHEFGNNSFRAYPISPLGIGNPIISEIGSDHSLAITAQGQGYMEVGGGNLLAVALSTPGVSNVVEIFDFVDSTGMVTNFRTLDLNSATGQVYGIEISPGGNKVYVTLKDASSQIYEFAIDDVTGLPTLLQQVTIGEELGAMQIGPDGQIYVARRGNTNVGTFSPNEDLTQNTNLSLQDFGLAPGTNSELGLPNFTQIISNPIMTPGLTVTGFCDGDSSTFSATGKDSAIDEFTFTVRDASNQIIETFANEGPEVTFLFPAPGTYTVTVVITNKCETNYATFTETVIINASPAMPTQPPPFCTPGDVLVLDANPDDVPGLTYLWSTGETTETISVTEEAIYDVTITSPEGCTTNASLFAVENRPNADLGPDLTLCEDAPGASISIPDNGDYTYSWTLNGVATGNSTNMQIVDTSVPGQQVYAISVNDGITGCTSTDEITITINDSPDWTSSVTPPTSCAAANGSIELTISGPAGSLFTYFISGTSGSFSDVDQPAGSVVSTGPSLDAGTYGITVTDQITGCATINTVNLNDAAFNVNVAQNGTCDPSIVIDVTTGVTDAVTYRVIDNATGLAIQGPTNATDGDFSTAPVLSGGTYVVEVTQQSPTCIASSTPLTITQDTPHVVTFDTGNLCSDNTLTAVSPTAGTFNWTSTPAGGLVNPTTDGTVTVTPGTWDLQVTASGPGACPAVENITVIVETPITPVINATDPCSDQVTLTAEPAGAFVYRWFRNGNAILGGRNLVIDATDNGAIYEVELVSTRSGCPYRSDPPHEAQVAGEISVAIQSTTPCEGSPFTLTAVPTPATLSSFTWTLDGVQLSPTSAALTETRGGLYTVSVTSSGCTATDEMNIEPGPVTPGQLVDSYIICPYETNPDPSTQRVILNPGTGFVSYEWFKEGISLGETDPTYEATETGNYSVNLLNAYGCPSSDQTVLVEECDPRITGPNAFRPSGLNQEFFLYTFFIADEDFQVFIFNRWGEMVFYSSARDFKWNGGYNNNAGAPLPPGTYTYLVKYKSSYRPDEGVKEKRGGVVLLR